MNKFKMNKLIHVKECVGWVNCHKPDLLNCPQCRCDNIFCNCVDKKYKVIKIEGVKL